MIVAVSMVDLDAPDGAERCVGLYTFEVDYPSGPSVRCMAVAVHPASEPDMRPMVGKFLQRNEIPNAVSVAELLARQQHDEVLAADDSEFDASLN
jgi:hypothetical protein